MSLARKLRRRRATIAGGLVGLIIIFTFVISLIAPDLGTRSSAPVSDVIPTLRPTAIVVPTPDPAPQLAGAAPYIHSSGYFRTFRPAGSDWTISEGQSAEDGGIVRVVFQSTRRLVVIHNYIQPGVEYETPQSLSENYLTEQHFAGAWIDYDAWQETGRAVSDTDVVADFTLESEGIAYLGRTIDRVVDGWLYATRLVVPGNDPALLDLLEGYVRAGFQGYPELQALDLLWPVFIDQQAGYMLKHSAQWEQVAGGVGRPVTFVVNTQDGRNTIRVWTEPATPVGSADQAATWLMSTDPTLTVLDMRPAQRGAGTGFEVAYTFRDTAGDPHSGLALLLNDAAGTLFAVTLQIVAPEVNLFNAQDLLPAVSQARTALQQGFLVLPEGDRSGT